MTPTDRSSGGVDDDDSDGTGTDDVTEREGTGTDSVDREAEQRRKRRAAVRPHESGGDPASPADADRDSASGAQWSPDGVDPEDVPWYFSPVSVDDPDPPPMIDRLGSIGIGLVLVAFGLAVVGIGAAAVGIEPYGRVAITLSLGLGAIAMLFGLVYQAFASDFLSSSE